MPLLDYFPDGNLAVHQDRNSMAGDRNVSPADSAVALKDSAVALEDSAAVLEDSAVTSEYSAAAFEDSVADWYPRVQFSHTWGLPVSYFQMTSQFHQIVKQRPLSLLLVNTRFSCKSDTEHNHLAARVVNKHNFVIRKTKLLHNKWECITNQLKLITKNLAPDFAKDQVGIVLAYPHITSAIGKTLSLRLVSHVLMHEPSSLVALFGLPFIKD